VIAGRRIGLTRPEPGPLADRLVAMGAHVVHVPLIEIADAPALASALARLASFDWLVVTSVNGATRVSAAAAGNPSVRLAAVGPATAAALAASAGRPVDLVPRLAQAEGLLAEFPRAPARVLVAQADRARRVLADGLAAAGHDVESVTAYRTSVRRPDGEQAERLRGVDAVVFASGSAAQGWAESIGTATPPVVVAIGPVSADSARRLGLTVTHVAESPDDDALVDVLVRALR
jgi:uroporphyrinogen-III synthase